MAVSGVRRALPWVSVALLAPAVAAGAGLSVARQASPPHALSAAQQISRIMVATRHAGTARFTLSGVGSSANPYLRSSDHEQGVVDFATHTLRASERDRSTGFTGTGTGTLRAQTQDSVLTTIWIGRTEYVRFGLDGQPYSSPWVKQRASPENSFGPLGALGQFSPLGELEVDLSVRGLRLDDRGPTVVRGTPTTRYLVIAPTCPTSKRADGAHAWTSPLELWVDGHGRLVQARVSTRVDISKAVLRADHLAHRVGVETGRSTDVSTIELGDFGAQTKISAPPVGNSAGAGESGVAIMQRTGCT